MTQHSGIAIEIASWRVRGPCVAVWERRGFFAVYWRWQVVVLRVARDGGHSAGHVYPGGLGGTTSGERDGKGNKMIVKGYCSWRRFGAVDL